MKTAGFQVHPTGSKITFRMFQASTQRDLRAEDLQEPVDLKR